MSKKSPHPIPLGRPVEFQRDQALDAALRVFWACGYEGASLTQLTAAMGINKPSLYAAFGDKRSLFGHALDRYTATVTSFAAPALEKNTAREVVRALLEGEVQVSTDTEGPGGCLLTHAAIACSPDSAEVRALMAERRLLGESRLRERLTIARREGDLPASADCRLLARYIVTLMQGIAVQGAAGLPRKDLQAIVRLVMMHWPPVAT